MKVIRLQFKPMFKNLILSGAKVATTRTRRHGRPGDRFFVFGEVFELTDVKKLTLGQVAEEHHKAEGFDSPAAFIDCWNNLHRSRRALNLEVYLHTFKRLVRYA